MKPTNVKSKQAPTFQDTRTPRTIYMNYHGYTQESLVQCWLCHRTALMREMTVHHLLEQRLCKKYPWHEDKIKDPSWMVALHGGETGCHEVEFNHYYHQSVDASLEIVELKHCLRAQKAQYTTQIHHLKQIIAGKATQNTNAQITNVQTALEEMQENLGRLNLALESVKD